MKKMAIPTMFVLLLAAGSAFAQSTMSPALPEWDKLTPQQREALVAPIRERWNSEPEQRVRMLDRAQRWQQMTPEQRRQAHHGMRRFERMNPEQREQARALFGKMHGMKPEERKKLMDQWKAMTPEQRREWIEKNPPPKDFPPPPPSRD